MINFRVDLPNGTVHLGECKLKGGMYRSGLTKRLNYQVYEVKGYFIPGIINVLYKNTVQFADDEYVLIMGFQDEKLRRLSLETTDEFNSRNGAGGKRMPDRRMLRNEFDRLKQVITKIVGKEGESCSEDGVDYYLYENLKFGIMVVNDANMGRVSFEIMFDE